MSDIDKKFDGAVNDVMNSVGQHVSGLGKTAFDALEDLLKRANENAPTEEGLKDFARQFGITFGDEDEKHGR